MKPLKPIIEISVPLYGVQIIICSSAEAADKKFGHGFLYKNYAAQVCVIECEKTGISKVTICFDSPKNYNTEVLSHECVHAAWRVLDLVGIRVSYSNQEPLAYLTGWIARQVNNFMVSHIETLKNSPGKE
ncbi:hypothetical protein [Yersinia kristensenii]|uniref:hypothetical protein n=1 Tax=Yersinia kristensenii TaxID=28152 RepID=UPI0011A5DDB1|nr:hypothetical protein [Yersinia kristensenii]